MPPILPGSDLGTDGDRRYGIRTDWVLDPALLGIRVANVTPVT